MFGVPGKIRRVCIRFIVLPFRLPQAVRDAIYWVKALDYASKSEYEAALQTLQKINSFRGALTIEADILKALLLKSTGRNVESFYLCKELKNRIEKTTQISRPNKAYLMSYTAWIANMNIEVIGGSFKEHHDFWDLQLENVALDSVSSHYKHNHPLRCHPEWD